MKAVQQLLTLRRHAAPAVAVVLGSAGLVASAVSNDDLEATKSSSSSSLGNEESGRTICCANNNSIVHNNFAPPTVTGVSSLPSLRILATSGDASAERSASIAAAARLSRNSLISNGKSSVSERSANCENTGDSANNNSSQGPANGKQQQQQQEDDDDSYPTFTPYHHSLLKKYLTPEVWKKISKRQTSFGTTIEDIIRAGVTLPIGASVPRRVGVILGDAECYTVFKELLEPIISHYHGIQSYEEWMDPELPMESHFKKNSDEDSNYTTANKSLGSILSSATTNDDYGIIKSGAAGNRDDAYYLLDDEEEDVMYSTSDTSTTANAKTSKQQKPNLRRHCTMINNPNLVRRKADPEGKYILSTRIRVARSLDGVRFPATMSRSDRRKVQRLVHDCTKNFSTPNLANGVYLPVLSMSNEQNLDLIERHILFDNPNEWTIASGLGRDWPDGRAIYANVSDIQSQNAEFIIWVNEEDHLRIMTLKKGGDIQGAFTSLMSGVRELERELQIRGWHFAKDSRLGYLTSCPTNVGTTMRASVHVRLVNLGKLPGFLALVSRLKLEARGKYGETDRQYTGIFDISNAERLGKSEVHLINVMVEGVAKLIQIEMQLENGEEVNIDDIAKINEK